MHESLWCQDVHIICIICTTVPHNTPLTFSSSFAFPSSLTLSQARNILVAKLCGLSPSRTISNSGGHPHSWQVQLHPNKLGCANTSNKETDCCTLSAFIEYMSHIMSFIKFTTANNLRKRPARGCPVASTFPSSSLAALLVKLSSPFTSEGTGELLHAAQRDHVLNFTCRQKCRLEWYLLDTKSVIS